MLTDQAAAEMVLRLINRTNFQGSELEAVQALHTWATITAVKPTTASVPTPVEGGEQDG